MKFSFSSKIVFTSSLILAITACAPQAPATPTVDLIGTTSAQLAAGMLTQTAGAVTDTPLPPAETATPVFTDTPAVPTEKPAVSPPRLIANTGCWTGPGDSYTLISNIETRPSTGKIQVTILGIGSEPGWYVIRNPYFNNPCWVAAENMEVDPNMDMNQFRMMTPGP